ncbi:MAG TPA: hypothetical protein VES73_08590 [Lamprocystis sp. (in: g-proteobacteria)]|nr:hypothetical protein [Lamprocystis sp. (in: g-proteobacteria)]
MNSQSRGRLSGVLVLGLLLAGCGTLEKDKRARGLQAATTGYHAALRWGYFETAYGYVHPDQRTGKELPSVFKDLRVTEYDVVQPLAGTGAGQTEATQTVTIDYLFEDRQVVKTVLDRQVWRYDPKLATWWLASGLPKFQ